MYTTQSMVTSTAAATSIQKTRGRRHMARTAWTNPCQRRVTTMNSVMTMAAVTMR